MIRLYKPTIKRKDMDAVLNCMVEEAIAPGEKNREFALMLKRHFQAVDVHLFRSYPRAMETALRAAGASEGKRIVLSALAPGWLASAALKTGASVTCVDAAEGSLAPEISDEFQADFLVLHEPVGLLPDFQSYRQLSCPVIEDITESFGGCAGEAKPGDAGSILLLGLEESHVITAGGGAALIVMDKQFAEPCREFADREGPYELLPDMNAVLAMTQFSRMNEYLERRREIFELFFKSLLKTRHHCLLDLSEDALSNCITFPVLIESDIREILKFTRKYKVETERTFADNALTVLGLEPDTCPRAQQFQLRTLSFPLYPLLSQDQLKTLVRVLAALP